MNNYRLFLLGFVTVSLVLLTGYGKTGVNNPSPTGRQSESVQIKKESPVNSKQKKAKNKRLLEAARNSAAEDAELQKALDLSIPFKDTENAWLNVEQSPVSQEDAANVFIAEQKKKLRSVDLNDQMLMSQEPEMDKRKSLDGAAIVINLKR